MLGVVVWDFKGEEGNSHKDEKQMFGKQMFAWPRLRQWTQRGILTDFARFLPVSIPSSHYSYLW